MRKGSCDTGLAGRAFAFARAAAGAALACAGLACTALACAASPAPAADRDALFAEFDARGFTTAEKRVLQLGLTLDRGYAGLIDGRWGPASQAALEAYAARAGVMSPDDPAAVTPMYLAAVLAAEAMAFVVDADLGYRGGPGFGHRLLAPSGAFETEPGVERAWLALRASGLEITLFVAGAEVTAAAHALLEDDLRHDPARYLVRREARRVTAGDGGRRLYARSDLRGSGQWVTTLIAENAGADPGLFEIVTASITTDPAADILIADGRLVALTHAAAALAGAPAPERAVPAALPETPPGDGVSIEMASGAGFFVGAADVVTAAHVVEDCVEVTLDDGAPLTVVARHPTLDLALLRSPRRSASVLPLATGRGARLGESVFALGYPLYGTLGTGLSMTRGNVSATAGLGDDPSGLTVTAPIHPGNSGGPLMSLDGEVVGVVVATIDKARVAEAFGALPENINFAVAGSELAAFLDAEGVRYPTGARLPLAPDGAVPEAVQAAVVPVLCWYD